MRAVAVGNRHGEIMVANHIDWHRAGIGAADFTFIVTRTVGDMSGLLIPDKRLTIEIVVLLLFIAADRAFSLMRYAVKLIPVAVAVRGAVRIRLGVKHVTACAGQIFPYAVFIAFGGGGISRIHLLGAGNGGVVRVLDGTARNGADHLVSAVTVGNRLGEIMPALRHRDIYRVGMGAADFTFIVTRTVGDMSGLLIPDKRLTIEIVGEHGESNMRLLITADAGLVNRLALRGTGGSHRFFIIDNEGVMVYPAARCAAAASHVVLVFVIEVRGVKNRGNVIVTGGGYYVMALVTAYCTLPVVLTGIDAGRRLVNASESIVFITVFRCIKDRIAYRTILLMSFRAVNMLICVGMVADWV